MNAKELQAVADRIKNMAESIPGRTEIGSVDLYLGSSDGAASWTAVVRNLAFSFGDTPEETLSSLEQQVVAILQADVEAVTVRARKAIDAAAREREGGKR